MWLTNFDDVKTSIGSDVLKSFLTWRVSSRSKSMTLFELSNWKAGSVLWTFNDSIFFESLEVLSAPVNALALRIVLSSHDFDSVGSFCIDNTPETKKKFPI